MMYLIHKDYLTQDVEGYMVSEIVRCHNMHETYATGNSTYLHEIARRIQIVSY